MPPLCLRMRITFQGGINAAPTVEDAHNFAEAA